MDGEVVLGIALAFLFVVLVIVMPMAAIWAVNTLFGTMIPYTFKTWLASLILGSIVGSSSARAVKRD